jgi:hypothetical protein
MRRDLENIRMREKEDREQDVVVRKEVEKYGHIMKRRGMDEKLAKQGKAVKDEYEDRLALWRGH